jgi:hypothetical protein
MAALEHIDVEECFRLSTDWLPESSCACVTTLKAAKSSLQLLPEGMAALVEVDVRNVSSQQTGYLRAAVRALRL